MASTINYPKLIGFPHLREKNMNNGPCKMRSIFISQHLWELIQEGYEQPLKDDTKESSWG